MISTPGIEDRKFYQGMAGRESYQVTRSKGNQRSDNPVVVSTIEMPQKPARNLMDIVGETAKAITASTVSAGIEYFEPETCFPNLAGVVQAGQVVGARMFLIARRNPAEKDSPLVWPSVVTLKAKRNNGGTVYELSAESRYIEQLEPFLVEMAEKGMKA